MAKKRKSKSKTKPEESGGRLSYQGLDRVMHEKARLGILASLAANGDGVLFNDLKQLCSLTDGNLSRHLSVLGEAGLVQIQKDNAGSRRKTIVQLTDVGRERFAEYIGVLEKVVADAQAKTASQKSTSQKPTGQSGLSGGFSPA